MGILVLLLIVLGFSALLLGIGTLLERLLPKPRKDQPIVEDACSPNVTAMDVATDGLSHHSAITELGHCINIDLPSCDGFL